jgi:hypothetical protein
LKTTGIELYGPRALGVAVGRVLFGYVVDTVSSEVMMAHGCLGWQSAVFGFAWIEINLLKSV